MNNLLYITHFVNAMLMVTIPILLAIYLTRKFKLGWRLWWIGAITFVLSQVGHIPFNRFLTYLFQEGILPSPPENWQLVFNAVILGLSAGIWEESARYASYRWWAKDARIWKKAILMGAGHGGIESILLGVLGLLTYFQLISLKGADLASIIPADQLSVVQQRVELYWSIAWPVSLLGSIERDFAILTHIALSVITLQVFTRKHIRWLWIAIGWHAFTNAVAIIILGTWGAYAAEVFLAVVAGIDLIVIFGLRRSETSIPIEEQPQPVLPSTVLSDITPQEVSLERLEDTKYN